MSEKSDILKKSIFIDETISTNLLLEDMCRETVLPEGFVVCADFQTVGKGQQGNSWEAEKGKNLLFSLLLYPKHICIEKQFFISRIVCLGLKNTLSNYVDHITIKWPNDIYWKDKKLSGILIQNTLQDASIKNSIIGIGLNVNQTAFTSDAPNPVSLRQITGKEYDKLSLLAEIHANIMNLYEKSSVVDIKNEYDKALYRCSGFHTFRANNEVFQAKIHSVHSDGLLELETKTGIKQCFYFKEVEFVISN